MAVTWERGHPFACAHDKPDQPASDEAEARAPRAAVFLDKDGTLVEDVPYNVDPALLRFTPRAVEALKLGRDAGYRLGVITNQSGLDRLQHGWGGTP